MNKDKSEHSSDSSFIVNPSSFSSLLVVKVGGSLYDLPDLGRRLRRFLASLDTDNRLIVPGGGPTADVIRAFDHDHRLGPQTSHWLALRACALNAHFLALLLPGASPGGVDRRGSTGPPSPRRPARSR